MAFLNLDLTYEENPKTRRLVGLLGLRAEIFPIRLWIHVGKFFPKKGRLEKHSAHEIEGILKWDGKAGEAAEAMVKTGFIEAIKDGYKVHDWDEHQGHIYSLKVRNKKVSINRWKNLRKVKSTVDTSGIPKPDPGVPRPSVTLPTEPLKSLNVKSVTTTPTTLRAGPKPNGTPKEFDKDVVDEIVEFCGDSKSRGYFISACRELGGGLLREALGELKMRLAEGQNISNRGAYVTTLLEEWGKSEWPLTQTTRTFQP